MLKKHDPKKGMKISHSILQPLEFVLEIAACLLTAAHNPDLCPILTNFSKIPILKN
jgi:hypothetical protein